MLNFIDVDKAEGNPLLEITKEFRRVQVSRFPLNVVFTSGIQAKFYDSRFPNLKPIANVWQDSDREGDYWVIESRNIVNEKYRNERRHRKQTKDNKKLLRFMRDYIKPISSQDVAIDKLSNFQHHIEEWKRDAEMKMRSATEISRNDVMAEIIRMKAIGYQPQTEKFARIMENGVEAWEEYRRRRERRIMQVHVLINPDDSVEVYCPDLLGYGGIQQGNNNYNSLEEIPVCIQQQVAMLRMMEDKAFIPEIGNKINSNQYWIEVMPEE
jgi:hypothetical protein